MVRPEPTRSAAPGSDPNTDSKSGAALRSAAALLLNYVTIYFYYYVGSWTDEGRRVAAIQKVEA